MSLPEAILLDEVVPVYNERFLTCVGSVRSAFAPATVTLLGDHTDYNDGITVSIALNGGTLVLGSAREQGEGCCVVSVDKEEDVEFSLSEKASWVYDDTLGGRLRSVLSKFMEVANLDPTFSFQAVIASDVAFGETASCCVAFFAFLEELCDQRFENKNTLCQEAMRMCTGSRVGCGESLAVLGARLDRAVCIDHRSCKTTQVAVGDDSVVFLVSHTTLDDSMAIQCKTREDECRQALVLLGTHIGKPLSSIRDLTLSDLEVPLDAYPLKRLCHVINSIHHAQQFLDDMKGGVKAVRLGALMTENLQSLRDHFEVTCTELDTLVKLASGCDGVLGCTVSGFGKESCVVSLVQTDKVEGVKEAISKGFAGKCEHLCSSPCQGVKRVNVSEHFPKQHVDECVLMARLLKDEGNRLVAAGNYKAALDKYSRMHFVVGGLVKSSASTGAGIMPTNKDQEAMREDEKLAVRELVKSMHMNKSLCYVKVGAWEKGVAAVTKALEFGGDELKCYFRRGTCYMKTGDLQRAKEDLEKALKLNGSDQSIVKALKELKTLDKAQDTKAKNAFSKMFS